MLIQTTTSAAPAGGRTGPVSRDPAPAQTVPVEKTAQPAQAQVDTQAVKAAVEASNRVVQTLQSKIEFVTDDSSGRLLVKVIDPSNDQVIRQIPSEEMLAISCALDRMQGLLVKSTA